MISEETIERTQAILLAPLKALPKPAVSRVPQPAVELSYTQFLMDCSDEDFIRLAYDQIMGRPATEHCLTQWSAFFKNGGSRAQLVHEFVRSEEGRQRKVHVHGLKYVLDMRDPHQRPCKRGLWAWIAMRLSKSFATRGESALQLVRMAEIAERNEVELERRNDKRQAEMLEHIAELQREMLQLRCSVRNSSAAVYGAA